MSYVTERAAGREHFPIYPKGFVAVRIIQLILGVICLGLSAYITSVIPITGAVLVLFTSIVCLISSVYILVAHFGPPTAYNYWAILGLDIFHVIFWLISFALLASQAALILSYTDYYYDGYYYGYTTYGSIAAAAAALGAVNWVVYIVALILHSIALHRHRKAGLHAMPGKSASATGAPPVAAAAEVPMQPQQPQTYYPQQQVHEVSYQQQHQPQPVQEVQQQSYQQQHY
ncbi:hypothetical protein F5Y07DRAFT_193787 [Xylaria sp. FL0933]|nr:hypothetical protein F5Y07DRAFT_193787 [Xylaria sp. FL0933]